MFGDTWFFYIQRLSKWIRGGSDWNAGVGKVKIYSRSELNWFKVASTTWIATHLSFGIIFQASNLSLPQQDLTMFIKPALVQVIAKTNNALVSNNTWRTHFMLILCFYNSWRHQKFSPANIYLFKVNNRNTRTNWEIYLKLRIKTPERRQMA